MRKTWAIFTKEVTTYFVSPIAYVILTVFLALSGYFFVNVLMHSREASLRYLFSNMALTFLFILPLLTMRLFAEEKSSNTFEILFTSPINEVQVVAGKYLASLFIALVILIPTLVYPICLTIYSDPDWGPILSGYLGIFLTAATFLAVGTMASAFTENQIIAALISFCLLLLYWTMGWIGEQMPLEVRALFENLSMGSHLSDFIKGIIDTRHLIYYLTMIFFHLTVCVLVLESQRWRE